MMKALKAIFIVSTLALLTACFEVEDKSDAEVVAALEAQNLTLQEQNAALLAQETPITVFGTIVDGETKEPVSEATVTIKVGAEWRAPITIAGSFIIEALPVNTDIVVLVKSATGAFLDRAYFGKTISVASGQFASQSMGNLFVSKGITKSYSVVGAVYGEAFEGLVFNYNTATVFTSGADISTIDTYKISSTYDATTELYSIILPKDILFQLEASGDIDGDGILDYTVDNSSFWHYNKISIASINALQIATFYVIPTEAYQPVELRIRTIDSLGNNIEDIGFYANDDFLGRIDISYDTVTQEYVFDYQSSGKVRLLMPSFTVEGEEDVHYSSAYIEMNWSSSETLSINGYGFQNSLPSNVEVIDGIATMVVQPKVTSINDTVYLVSSVVDEANDYSLKQFYQAPIGLLDDSVSLTHLNRFKVIKGNQSDSDLVPAGTTQIGNVNEVIAVSSSLVYNDTFLTATPETVLGAGSYRYEIDQLVNRATGNSFNSNSSTSFTIENDVSGEIFSIDDIQLDNNNATTNGVQIVAANTAGEPGTATNNRTTAHLYFPVSIETLDYLELNIESAVINGNLISVQRQYRVVNGESILVNSRNLVSLADNENVESFTGSNYYNADTQTAQSDGSWYTQSTYVYANDNTLASVNTATFTYIYRVTGEDVVHEGTITLPVQ